MINLNFIYSELFLAISIMALLIIGAFKKNSSVLIYNLSIISLLACLTLIFNFPINENTELFILSSLVFPIIVFGFYPEPLLNTVEVSIRDLIEMYNNNLNINLIKN